ncbi:MAG: DUF368 domain-containing protein [Gammaproteobacteria bacterium]
MRSKIILAIKGMCMGTADVIPGVSGGTMAFILGIYEQLLAAIKSFDLECLKRVFSGDVKGAITRPHFGFIIPLFIGIIAALMFFTRVIPLPKLIISHPELIYGLFFGLILGSIVVLLKHIGEINLKDLIMIGAGIIAGLLIVTMTPKDTPDVSWFIFFCGAIAITAMILPGISGSFILLILGKYAYILDGISHFNISILIPFALGAASGLIFFSRFLSWLLAHFHKATLLIINGILIGSLWVIWPFQNREYVEVREKKRLIDSTPILPEGFDSMVMNSLLLMLVGFSLVLFISYLGDRKK